MNIRIYGVAGLRNDLIPYSRFTFPGGEVQVKLEKSLEIYRQVNIRADLRNAQDIMALLMLTDAIRQSSPGMPISLVMPYIPYSRQDRVCDSGEALAIKVFAGLINSQNYTSVLVWDSHSDVAVALLDRCRNVEPSALVRDVPVVTEILVSPDAGANKKIFKLAKAYGDTFKQVIRADKVRDVKTGAITDTIVYCDDLRGQNVLIVDDICDGGRTFIELAAKLKEKNAGKIYLYVTHGIFSKGLEVFHGLIDQIYTPNSFIESNDPILVQL